LFYAAMQSGWNPPAAFDTTLAFGQGAATVDVFGDMVDRINSDGGNPKHVDVLIQDIGAMPCSPIQRDLLVTSLKAQLKDGGILDKKLGDKIDALLRKEAPAITQPKMPLPQILNADDIPELPLSRPSSVHGCNADQMVNEIFQNRLAVIDGVTRFWSGREWQLLTEEKAFRLASQALKPDQCKAPNISGTLKLLPTSCDVRPTQAVDRRAFFANGVLNMTTGVMEQHNADNNNTGCMEVEYNPQATCPQWFDFLRVIFGGLEDELDRVNLLQEIMGWALIKDDLNVQKIIALDGASRGGKGVILEVLQAVLGANKWGTTEFAHFDDGKTQSNFRNKDVLFDMEAKPPAIQNIKRAIGFMNKVASNEPVSIPLLHTQTPWEGKLNAKFIFACNGIPMLIDDSGATTNRIVTLMFDRSFKDREDFGLVDRLTLEAEGVAAWAVKGLRRLLANNCRFTTPASSAASITNMQEDNQPLLEFINSHLKVEPTGRAISSNIWEAYRTYAADCNVKLPSRTQFYKSLRQSLLGADGVKESRAVRVGERTGQGYTGLTIRTLTGDAFGPQLQAVK